MHRTTAHKCLIITAFLYPIVHAVDNPFVNPPVSNLGQYDTDQVGSLIGVAFQGQEVTIDTASCQNPAPGYTLNTINEALTEAFDMARYATNFVGTDAAFLNYRVRDTFETLLGSPQNSPVANEARDAFNNVVNRKAGLSGSKIFCSEDWLQIDPDADGQEATYIDTLTGKRWRSRDPRALNKPCEQDSKPLAYFNTITRYMTICPHSWPRYGRPTLGTSRTANYNGVFLWAVRMPLSYALLHEMLHAASVLYARDGPAQLRVIDQPVRVPNQSRNPDGPSTFQQAYGFKNCFWLARTDRMTGSTLAVRNADSLTLLAFSLYFVNTDFRKGIGQRYDPAATIPDFSSASGSQCNR